MGRRIASVAALAVGFLALTLTLALEASAKSARLTKDTVERFLLSFPEIRVIGLREGLNVGMKAQSSENPFATVIETVTRKELREEVQGVISRHGFASVKDWAATGQSIGHAYLHLTSGAAGSTAASKMDENREKIEKEIDKLGFLSEKQKRKLLEKYDEASDDLGREPPPENVAVVKEMKPRIEAVVKGRAN